jgi:medium-chain acyl-[acyl-carrier-protein] hydrolase
MTAQYQIGQHIQMIKLMCFPYAGASSVIYKMWQIVPTGNVIVRPVELPGRGLRHREPPLDSIPELANCVVSEYWPEFSSPFALFGHSFGSLLAFAVAQQLATHNIYPVQLFISASRSPHQRPQNLFHRMDTSELLAQLVRLKGIPAEMMGEEDLINFVLPRIRADLHAAETYCVKAASLPVPITAFGGTEDLLVTESELAGWRACTSEEFCLRMFHGHHFYLQTQGKDLLSHISNILATPLSSRPCVTLQQRRRRYEYPTPSLRKEEMP